MRQRVQRLRASRLPQCVEQRSPQPGIGRAAQQCEQRVLGVGHSGLPDGLHNVGLRLGGSHPLLQRRGQCLPGRSGSNGGQRLRSRTAQLPVVQVASQRFHAFVSAQQLQLADDERLGVGVLYPFESFQVSVDSRFPLILLSLAAQVVRQPAQRIVHPRVVARSGRHEAVNQHRDAILACRAQVGHQFIKFSLLRHGHLRQHVGHNGFRRAVGRRLCSQHARAQQGCRRYVKALFHECFSFLGFN